MSQLHEIEYFINERPGAHFTLEEGRGETYASGEPTLYCHSRYPRGSVLAGQDRREFVATWESEQDAITELDAIKVALPGFRYSNLILDMASTHRPVAEMVAHLPEDEG